MIERAAPTIAASPAVRRVAGDKSLSHRALIIAARAAGRTRIEGLAPGADVARTRACLAALGVPMRDGPDGAVTIAGGAAGWHAPAAPLDCGNSATTMRLLAGALAAAPFAATLIGDASLSRRPMARVVEPLAAMGARVRCAAGGTAPIEIAGGARRGIAWRAPAASAQLASALLLAGLAVAGRTTVVVPAPARDHTERLLGWYGVPVASAPEPGGGVRLTLDGPAVPRAPGGEAVLRLPGDPSRAAFDAAAAALVPGARIAFEDLLLNPQRTGFLAVLARMGAGVEVAITEERAGEPVGRVRITGAPLVATTIDAAEIPALIDEVPALAVAAAAARGTTVIRGAAELRVKECDRLHALAVNLDRLGIAVQEHADGLAITGGPWRARSSAGERGARAVCVESFGDHRIALALAVAARAGAGPLCLHDADCVAASAPGFFDEA